MNHKGTQKIETERLILRRFKVSDAPHMFNNWANDSEVTKYLTWQPHENVQFTEKLLADWIENYNNDKSYNWCIELKETSQPIGSIAAVMVLEKINIVEIGYCMGKEYWSKGIMSEALNAIIDFFFKSVNVNRVQAKHDTNNPASGRVMAKCGMNYEGTLIQAGLNQQGLCDVCLYAIINN